MFATLRTWFARLFMVLGLIFLSLTVGLLVMVHNVARDTGLDNALIPLFKAAYFLTENYIEPIDKSSTKKRLLAGLIDHLDPHTSYLPPEDTKSWQENMLGFYGGIGIGAKPSPDKKTLIIRDVFEQGPAAKSGLKVGDAIIAIDGEMVYKHTQYENFKRIRGLIGSQVALEIAPKDGGASQTINVARAAIELPTAQWRLLDGADGKVLWLRESRFNEDMVRQTFVAILGANKEAGGNITGILLDLRDNPGGLITSAVGLAAFFGEPGALVVSSKGRGLVNEQKWMATREDWSHGTSSEEDFVAKARQAAPWLSKVPMAVLVNRRSASASEIVAAALKDWKRATIVGNDTFGKGSVQSIIPLGDGNGSMKITTSRYYTPLGRAIQAVGVPVDVKVDSLLDRGLREADLPQHLKGEVAKERRGDATKIGPDGELMPDNLIDIKDPLTAAELAIEDERTTFSSRLKAPGGDAFVAAGIKVLSLAHAK